MEAKPQHGSAFILLFSKYGFRVCSVKATDSGAGQKVEEKKKSKNLFSFSKLHSGWERKK